MSKKNETRRALENHLNYLKDQTYSGDGPGMSQLRERIQHTQEALNDINAIEEQEFPSDEWDNSVENESSVQEFSSDEDE